MSREEFETRVLRELSEVKELLTGNGTPSKGLIVRVDRLEQRDEARTFWTRSAIAMALASGIAAVGAIFKK